MSFRYLLQIRKRKKKLVTIFPSLILSKHRCIYLKRYRDEGTGIFPSPSNTELVSAFWLHYYEKRYFSKCNFQKFVTNFKNKIKKTPCSVFPKVFFEFTQSFLILAKRKHFFYQFIVFSKALQIFFSKTDVAF